SLFNTTLGAFKNSGEITGTAGQQTFLPAASTDKGQQIVDDTLEIWEPFYGLLNRAIVATDEAGSTLQDVLQAGTRRSTESINTLLGLMNDLTIETELSATAKEVNLAGRQRMLSQRIAKSLLQLTLAYQGGTETDASLTELTSAARLFDATLLAFEQGGATVGVDGNAIDVDRLSAQNAQNIIRRAKVIWEPLNQEIANIKAGFDLPVEQRPDSTDNLLNEAAVYAGANINSVLKLMNDLTNEVESVASAAAERSRLIQSLGIVAALLCFAIIMYRIFGQLRVADQQIESAQRETQQIFDTVDQGLFLLDNDLVMGDQYSREMEDIFGESRFDGRSFTGFISRLISASDLDKVKRYVGLLFDPHKKQALIQDLNPLHEVPVQIQTENDVENKYLRFGFTRVMEGDDISRVLTSVADITKEVRLARELERESKRNEQQLDMISSLMNADPALLPLFLANSDKAYVKINSLLREPAKTTVEFKAKADQMMSLVHGIKGEAAALSLSMVSESCHDLEQTLQEIKNLPSVDGNDFVAATVGLDQLLSYNEVIQQLQGNVFQSLSTTANTGTETMQAVTPPGSSWKHLDALANEIAERQDKHVRLSVAGLDNANLEESFKAGVNKILTQLIRNSVVHGIEVPQLRERANKDTVGEVSIALYEQSDGSLQLSFQDDGRGIDFEGLKDAALAKNLLTPHQIDNMKNIDLVNLLFISALSTQENADMDSGRGMGMNAIRDAVAELGGSMSIKTGQRNGTRFLFSFPKTALQAA
ncbi:MAG: type IV pili methyl-accepting chemotaxis transducer N-terminal domain-containing protein, partial [Pseudomonadota bacterium]